MRHLRPGIILLLLLTPSAWAALPCHVEPTPAATLLLPYFEQDLNNLNGATTLFSVNNASNQPVLVKGEVWSDLGVPIFGFLIYLKGNDVQTVSLKDLLIYGKLPQTGPGNFGSCIGALPPATIGPGFLWNYQRALTGQSVDLFAGRCAGRYLGDNIARGYITMDVVNGCTTLFPGNSGYFGLATNQNSLWGDYIYANGLLSQAEQHPMVHIEADSTNPLTAIPGQYTFYGKFVSWTSIDNRVPLATNFAARYANNGLSTSDFVVWRDSKVSSSSFSCGTLPSWYPLGQTSLIAFDENSLSTVLTTKAFPAVAQRVRVGSSALPVPYAFGWLFLDLNTSVPSAGNNPPVDPIADQAWVTVTQQSGALLIGTEATRLDSACIARHSGPGI